MVVLTILVIPDNFEGVKLLEPTYPTKFIEIKRKIL